MLSVQVIGVGAAGNKGVLTLNNFEVVPINNSLLVNSTIKDIPKEYTDNRGSVVQIGNKDSDGCGKEREEGKRLALAAIQSSTLDLESFIKPDAKLVIIATSTEGGTGSGAAIVIAKYLRDVMHVEVKIYAFTGFEEDSRGLRNTVEFFKDLKEDYSIHTIRNKKFLEAAGNNFTKAEALANEEFARQVSLLIGNPIIASDTNMDDTDLRKVTTNHGYSEVLYAEIDDKIKSVDQFKQIVKSMISNSKGMDISNPTQTLMGVILNIPEVERDFIDYSWSDILDKYGEPFERFRHIQYDNKKKRFISIMITGMEIPIDEITEIYDRYTERRSKVSKDRSNFSAAFGSLEMEDDAEFDFRGKNKEVKPSETDKNAFFSSFNMETPNVPKNTPSNKPVKSNDNSISKY